MDALGGPDFCQDLFEKGERRDAKRSAKEISKSQPVGSAVAQTIAAIRAAAVIAASS